LFYKKVRNAAVEKSKVKAVLLECL
jgi:hypothetical protein